MIRSPMRAAIAGIGPAVLAAALGSTPPLSWIVAALALPLGLLARPRTRAARGPWIVGIVLAVAAAISATRARTLVDVTAAEQRWPTFDLAVDPVPIQLPEYVAVTGVLRAGVVLDEYDVPPGAIPDQSRPAVAVLVPLAPSVDPGVPMRGPIVVARLHPREASTTGRTTVRGRTEPMAPELLATILDLVGAGERPDRGVIVDTLRVPTPREAWTAAGVAALLGVLALVAHALAARSRA